MTTDQDQPNDGDSRRRPFFRDAIGRIRTRGLVSLRPIAMVAAVLAVLGAGYFIGATETGAQQQSADTLSGQSFAQGPTPLRPATVGAGLTDSGAGVGAIPASSAAPFVPSAPNEFASVADTSLIVKTGQLTLQVASLDSAVSKAQTQVTGMGGYAAASTRSGSADNASATVTYRLPVAHWDEALSDLRKLASKVVSEQTDSSDVTSQAIDLDARLSNLKTTESALQAIMARATAIPDVLAVEQQLSTTQGQIEQLTAQRNHLGDQAAMSTVAVTFTLPNETVTTQTAQGWQLGGQIDQAVGQLVRIGQGLVTIVVWAVIVGLPVLLALLVLFVAWRLSRRLMGRGHRPDAAPTQA